MCRLSSDASLQIIASSLAAEKRKSAQVEIEDIKRVYRLFVDVKRSTAFLAEYQGEYMYNELNEGEGAVAEDGKEDATMSTSP